MSDSIKAYHTLYLYKLYFRLYNQDCSNLKASGWVYVSVCCARLGYVIT